MLEPKFTEEIMPYAFEEQLGKRKMDIKQKSQPHASRNVFGTHNVFEML